MMKKILFTLPIVLGISVNAGETLDEVYFGEPYDFANVMDLLPDQNGNMYSLHSQGCDGCSPAFYESYLRFYDLTSGKGSSGPSMKQTEIWRLAADKNGAILGAGHVSKNNKSMMALFRAGKDQWESVLEWETEKSTRGNAYDVCVRGDEIVLAGSTLYTDRGRTWTVFRSPDNGKSWSIIDEVEGNLEKSKAAFSMALACPKGSSEIMVGGYVSELDGSRKVLFRYLASGADSFSTFSTHDTHPYINMVTNGLGVLGDGTMVAVITKRDTINGDNINYLLTKSPSEKSWKETLIPKPSGSVHDRFTQLFVDSQSRIWLTSSTVFATGSYTWRAIVSSDLGQSWVAKDTFTVDGFNSRAIAISENSYGEIFVGGNLDRSSGPGHYNIIRRIPE